MLRSSFWDRIWSKWICLKNGEYMENRELLTTLIGNGMELLYRLLVSVNKQFFHRAASFAGNKIVETETSWNISRTE